MQKQVAFFFLFFSGFLLSQNPNYLTIDKSSGLPSNSVYDIFQDSKGFMWFATSKGLCRFDGTIIKTFESKTQTSKSGSSIQEDYLGRIWYENFDGFLFYIENDTLKTFHDPKNIGYYRFGIVGNSLFVLQEKTVNIYNLQNLQLQKKVDLPKEYYKFSYASKNHFYVLSNQLYQIDEKGTKKEIKLPKNYSTDFSSPIITSYKDGIIICSKFKNKYVVFNNNSFKTYSINYPIDFFQNLATFDNEIWFCGPKGLFQIKDENQVNHFFNKTNVSYLFKDNRNNYWVSTLNEGVFFIENFDTKLYTFDKIPNKITSYNQTIIIGTDKDELYNFDVLNKTFNLVYKGDTNHEINQLLYDETTKSLFFTSAKFRILQNQKLTLDRVIAIKDISQIDDKYVSFAATNNSGIIVKNKELKSRWDVLFEKNKDTSNLFFNNAYFIIAKNGKSTVFNPINNTIYYATNNGLIAQNSTSQKEITFNNQIYYFTNLKYANGKVYALTTNDQLFVIDSNHKINPYDFPAIYADKKVENIKIQNHFLYVFFANEIVEINLINKAYKRIIATRKDVLLNDITLINQQIFIATSKGILVKNRTTAEKNNDFKLLINKIVVNDKKADFKTENAFAFNENNLKIDFSILSFSPNQKNALSYQINNSKWYNLDANDRTLNLFALSPGSYSIKLRVNQSPHFEELLFTIKNPFWKTSYFIFLVLLTIMSIIYVYYQKKIQQIQKRNQLLLDRVELEKNLNQTKLKAIKSQMNPHFFYNALNTLQSYILSNEKKQAIEYLSKFSNLTRTILEATENDFITLKEEIKTLELYLEIEKARFNGDFNYKIILENSIDDDSIKIPTLLIQPYVENAVKHGLLHKKGSKNVTIIFDKQQDFLEITIDDNGIGRKKSAELNFIKNKQHTSFATDAMQKRLALLNSATNTKASIEIIDKTTPQGQHLGTLVILKIPVNY